jgi:hypothetical protein
MKQVIINILTSNVFWQIVVNVLLLGIVVYWFQARMAPAIAEETLKRQNLINYKKDAYLEAIDIVNRYFITTEHYLPDSSILFKPDTAVKKPSQMEMNTCMVKLYIYSGNHDIPKLFAQIFVSKKDFLINSLNFFNMLGVNLSKDFREIKKDEFNFIIPGNTTTN